MNFRPHHTAISVRNLDVSLRFYELLGYKRVYRFDEEDGSMSIVHLKLGDSFLEVFHYPENKTVPPVNWEYANNLKDIGVKHIALRVENIEEALSDLRAKGLADEHTNIEASDTGKAWWFFIQDPDGVWVEIIRDDRYS